MLLWKICPCNLSALEGSSSGWSVYLFPLCFFVHGLNVCTSVVSDCDPMLSICAWESQPSRFVLMGPDRSPICSAQSAALQLDADAILHHKTQYQQSSAVTTKGCFWHWILFTHVCFSSSTYYLQNARCFCNSLTNKYWVLEKLQLMSLFSVLLSWTVLMNCVWFLVDCLSKYD